MGKMHFWLIACLVAFLSATGCGGGGGGGGGTDPATQIGDTPILLAVAGPDLTVFVGTNVTLDGRASEGDGINYSWAVTPSSGVTLDAANSATPIFRAQQAGAFTIRLTVNREQKSHSDELTITAIYPLEIPGTPGSPGSPGTPENPLEPFTSRMIRADMGGPIGGLKGTSDGGLVAAASVGNPSQVRFTKFAADGSQVATSDFGTPGNDRPVAVIEISANEFAVLGVADHAANGLGEIFIARVTIDGNTATSFFNLVPGLTQCSVNNARRAPDGDYLLAGIDARTDSEKGDMLFAKIATNGSLLWSWSPSYPSGSDLGRDIIELSGGDFIVLGTFRPRGNVVGDDTDIYLARISGQTQTWSRVLGDPLPGFNEYALALETSSEGLFILGSGNSHDRQGSVNFDIMAFRVDTDGNLFDPTPDLFGQPGMNEFSTSLIKLSDDTFLVTGAAQAAGKGYDAYLAKIDLTNPNLLAWEKRYGGIRDDLAMSVIPQGGGFLLSGLADGQLTFTSPENYTQSGAVWLANVTNTGNVSPSSILIPNQVRTSGMPFLLNLSAFFYDIGGDTLTFSATGLPSSLTLDPDTGVLLGVAPIAHGVTDYEITITASDDELTTSQTFTLKVNPAN